MTKNPTKAFVLPVNGRAAEVSQLKALITKAGCEVVSDKGKPAEYEKCAKEADVLVVLICAETDGDPDIDKLIAATSRAGKRVVGVWVPNAGVTDIPPGIHKHADAAITLDVDAIRNSICGGKPMWTTSNGTPRKAPTTPRHKG